MHAIANCFRKCGFLVDDCDTLHDVYNDEDTLNNEEKSDWNSFKPTDIEFGNYTSYDDDVSVSEICVDEVINDYVPAQDGEDDGKDVF